MRGWRSRPMSARRPAVPAYMPVAGLGIGMCLPWSLLLGCEVHGAGELVAGDVDVEAGACDVVGLVDFAVRGGHGSFRVAAVGHEDSAGADVPVMVPFRWMLAFLPVPPNTASSPVNLL